jgi:nucleotide-binding universal stress UspA family protein
MFEKILVPLDGSPLAELALTYGEEIGAKLGSELILIGVCESGSSKLEHIYRCYLDSKCEEMCERIRKHHGIAEDKLTVRRVIVTERPQDEIVGHASHAVELGRPAGDILDYIEKSDIDLVAMCTHGYSGVKRWVLGSVANGIVRGTNKPVLLIRASEDKPTTQRKEMFSKILLPLDGSELAEAVLPYVEELVFKLKTEVYLLHVMEHSSHLFYLNEDEMRRAREAANNYLDRTRERLLGKGLAIKSDAKVGRVADEICRYADEIDASLIAMSTHTRAGLGLMLGSVADEVIRHSKKPVLVMPGYK